MINKKTIKSGKIDFIFTKFDTYFIKAHTIIKKLYSGKYCTSKRLKHDVLPLIKTMESLTYQVKLIAHNEEDLELLKLASISSLKLKILSEIINNIKY